MARHRWDPICPPPRRLVRPVRMDPTGVHGPTRGQAQGPHWRQTSYGLYVPATVTDDLPEQRIMEQSARLPAVGAVTGWAGCRLHRASFFDGLLTDGSTRMPVPLCVGERGNLRADARVVLSRERLDRAEVVVVYGIPCTRRLRSLFDAMRWAPDLREAVVAMDMMAAAEAVSIRQMRVYVVTRAGWRGVGQVRAALDLADERSRSPNETRMRLIWVLDAGFPRPLVNQPIFDLHGRLLGIADLLDPVAGVVGEFDGADHRRARRHSSDVDREGGLRDHALEVFRVTGPNIRDRALVARRMRSARSRARWLPPGQRSWTIEPPPGWEPELCLDDLLAQRERDEAFEEQLARERAARRTRRTRGA